MKFKSSIFFSLLVLTLFSFSCSHSGKPDVNSMTEAQVDHALGKYLSLDLFMYVIYPPMNPCGSISINAQNFLQDKQNLVEYWKTKHPKAYKHMEAERAERENSYYKALPGKILAYKQQLKTYLDTRIKLYSKQRKTLPTEGKALLDRKIYFLKQNRDKQLSQVDSFLKHLPETIASAKKKARESASK